MPAAPQRDSECAAMQQTSKLSPPNEWDEMWGIRSLLGEARVQLLTPLSGVAHWGLYRCHIITNVPDVTTAWTQDKDFNHLAVCPGIRHCKYKGTHILVWLTDRLLVDLLCFMGITLKGFGLGLCWAHDIIMSQALLSLCLHHVTWKWRERLQI